MSKERIPRTDIESGTHDESIDKKEPSTPLEHVNERPLASARIVFHQLSVTDRLLTPIILLAMIVGVLIGVFAKGVQEAFDVVRFDSVSLRRSIFVPLFSTLTVLGTFSYCYRTYCHDVAYPYKSS